MIWVWAGIGWIVIGWLAALYLGELWRPKTEVDRQLDDEAQKRFLREYAEKHDNIIDLRAKIPGGEA